MSDQNFPLELENLRKRCWLPASVALAVILVLGFLFISYLRSYSTSNISLQVEF